MSAERRGRGERIRERSRGGDWLEEQEFEQESSNSKSDESTSEEEVEESDESTSTEEAAEIEAAFNSETIERALKLPCSACGSELAYNATSQKIACGHCGKEEEIEAATDRVEELSLSEALNKAPKRNFEQTEKQFHCDNCGASYILNVESVRIKCGYCGSNNVNEEAFETNQIQPNGVIPFKVDQSEAQTKFQEWLGKGFFTPRKLKRLARSEKLIGMYVPFWTYDADTSSVWSGYAGEYYYVPRTVVVNGKTQTRQERKVRWHYRSGSHRRFFDDVLVSGSKKLPQKKAEKLYPFYLNQVINFDPKALVGWEAEVYEVDLKDGYKIADGIMDAEIRQDCSRMLGGDTQKGLTVRSQKFGQTFKHILLPCWISAYAFKGKMYQFFINGQTGKVDGNKPIDKGRVAMVVILVLLALGAGWIIYNMFQG